MKSDLSASFSLSGVFSAQGLPRDCTCSTLQESVTTHPSPRSHQMLLTGLGSIFNKNTHNPKFSLSAIMFDGSFPDPEALDYVLDTRKALRCVWYNTHRGPGPMKHSNCFLCSLKAASGKRWSSSSAKWKMRIRCHLVAKSCIAPEATKHAYDDDCLSTWLHSTCTRSSAYIQCYSYATLDLICVTF